MWEFLIKIKEDSSLKSTGGKLNPKIKTYETPFDRVVQMVYENWLASM